MEVAASVNQRSSKFTVIGKEGDLPSLFELSLTTEPD